MTREEAIEEGIRCAMCTNTIKSDTGCDGGCIVDTRMYNKVMTEINSRLLRRPPVTPQEPCEDAVSRAEVKKIAKEMYLEVANMELDAKTISDCISCASSKCREVLERKLRGLPPAPQEPSWIPVTEGLPEEDGRYLVTVENLTGYDLLDSNVFECEFCYTDWIFKGWKDNKVIAWMPLPKPYKAESEVEDGNDD